MLQPARTKYRKLQKGRVRGMATSGNYLGFGQYGLQALERGKITSRQIEASRVAMARFIKKGGKIWIRIFPDMPYTRKAPEVPMGMGKGDPQGYCVIVRPGRIVFEIDGVSDTDAREALRKAGTKLPLKSKVVKRDEV